MGCNQVDNIIQDIASFINELLDIETKKQVLIGRVDGETIRETAQRLNVTDERIRQIEAKITRKFALSQNGQRIISTMLDIQTSEELKLLCGTYYLEIVYFLRLYKESFFYNGESFDKLTLYFSCVQIFLTL